MCNKMLFIDGHCDTLSKALDENKKLDINDLQFSFQMADEIGGGIQIMACFIEPTYLKEKNGGFIRCNEIIKKINEYEEKNNKKIIIKNKKDLQNAIINNKTKVILSVENGSAISGNIKNIEFLYNKGIRIMSLTWNEDNDIACGANTKNDRGLTCFGIEYIKKLVEYNILIDVSHLSEKSFWDVVNLVNVPIVATHSNVYNICKNPRNLKDNQIKAIANSGGIIGICFYSEFLNSNSKANIKDIIKHIKYIKDLVGIDYIGLGSDFDGMSINETAEDVKNINELVNVIKELKKEGFSEEEINKIMKNNWLRVLNNLFI